MTLKRRLDKLEKQARSKHVAMMYLAFVWAATERGMEWPFAIPFPPRVYPLQQTGIGGTR